MPSILIMTAQTHYKEFCGYMNEKNMFRKSTFLILLLMVILSSLPVAALAAGASDTAFSYDIDNSTYLGWLKETNETGVYMGIIESVTGAMDDVLGGLTFTLIYVGLLGMIAVRTESIEVPLVISVLVLPSFSLFGYFGLSMPLDVLAYYVILIGVASAAVIFGAFMVFMRR